MTIEILNSLLFCQGRFLLKKCFNTLLCLHERILDPLLTLQNLDRCFNGHFLLPEIFCGTDIKEDNGNKDKNHIHKLKLICRAFRQLEFCYDAL
jgi:hypothetical protein